MTRFEKYMFKYLVLILSCMMGYAADAQPFVFWQHTFGGSGNDLGLSMQQAADSGFIATGVTYSGDGDVTGYRSLGDLWVVKTNSTGLKVWENCYGGSGYDEGDCIRQTSDGGYIVAGYTNSADGNITHSFGGYDAWLLRLDDTGAVAWQYNYGGSGTDWLASVQQTTDGGYIAVGSTTSTDGEVRSTHGGGAYDVWVVRLNDTGGIKWSKTFGGTGDDEGWSVQQTTDGGYIVGGYTSSHDGDVTGFHGGAADYWALKLNDTGGIVWKHTYGGNGDDESQSITQTSDGGYIMTGNSSSTNGDVTGNHGGYDLWTVKLNDTGGIAWQKCYGGTGDDNGQNISQTRDGGYIVTGSSYSSDGDLTNNKGQGDLWVVRTKGTGALQWQKNVGGDSLEIGFSAVETLDGAFAVLGFTQSANADVTYNHGAPGTSDFWLVKFGYKPEGVAIVSNEAAPVVYPNPARGVLNVKLPAGFGAARLELSDMMGRKVFEASGTAKERAIDMNGYADGTYVLKVIGSNNMYNISVVHNR